MYSLACLTNHLGATVSGSDALESERTAKLVGRGIKVYIGHSPSNVIGASLVVFSHAVSEENPELCEARRLAIPTVTRAEYLGAIMLDYSHRIAVSGSHGKSTTTAMIDMIFDRSGIDHTTLSGAEFAEGEPFRIGEGSSFICEACEYRDSFLRFSPTIALSLNLELDHTDYFSDIEALKKSFCSFLSRAKNFALINGDDENLREIIPFIKTKVITFGSSENNDYRYKIIGFEGTSFLFSVSKFGSSIGEFRLNIPGAFNIHNATAAIALAVEFGISMEHISDSIASFSGIEGRLEYIGNHFGRPVYLDYAHHPTEISASINALKSMILRPLTVVFKPHTYSRTKAFWHQFRNSLSLADHLIITDIFPAREEPIEGITSKRLALDIEGAIYSEDKETVNTVDRCTDGAIVLMGAGNFNKIRKEIING